MHQSHDQFIWFVRSCLFSILHFLTGVTIVTSSSGLCGPFSSSYFALTYILIGVVLVTSSSGSLGPVSSYFSECPCRSDRDQFIGSMRSCLCCPLETLKSLYLLHIIHGSYFCEYLHKEMQTQYTLYAACWSPPLICTFIACTLLLRCPCTSCKCLASVMHL